MESFLITSVLLLWVFTLLNFLGILAVARQLNKNMNQGMYNAGTLPQLENMIAIGDAVPEFTIENPDGSQLTENDFRGREWMVVFITPNCPACKERLARLEEAYKHAERKGIGFVVISTTDIDQSQQFIQETKTRLPIFSAPRDKNHLSDAFKVNAYPSYYEIDSNGKVRNRGLLDLTWEQLVARWRITD